MIVQGREVCTGEVDFVFGHSQAGWLWEETEKRLSRVRALSYVIVEEG